MKNFELLHELLAHLNQSEWKAVLAYLRRNRKSDSKTAGMLTGIRELVTPDEAEFLLTFNDPDFLRSNRSKTYMDSYNLILRAMSGLQGKGLTEMMEIQIRINILATKCLFDHASRQIEKAIAKAKNEELFQDGIKVLQLVDSLVENEILHLSLLDPELDTTALEAELRDKDTNLAEYAGLLKSVFKVRSLPIGQKEVELEVLLNHPLLNDESRCLSYRAKICLHRSRYIIHFHLQRYSNALEELKAMENIYLDRPFLTKDLATFSDLYWILFSIAIISQVLGDYQAVNGAIARLEPFSRKGEPYAEQAQVRLAVIKVNLAIYTQDESGEAFVAQLSNQMKGKSLDSRLGIHAFNLPFQMGMYSIYHSQPGESIAHLLPLWNMPIGTLRPEIHGICLLMFLVAHLDLGNFQFVLDNAKSVAGRIKKTGKLDGYCAFVIEQITLLAKQEESTRMETLQTVKRNFSAFFSIATNQQLEHYFDFPNWIQAKIEGVSVLKYLKNLNPLNNNNT
jgi:hypothetical protein